MLIATPTARLTSSVAGATRGIVRSTSGTGVPKMTPWALPHASSFHGSLIRSSTSEPAIGDHWLGTSCVRQEQICEALGLLELTGNRQVAGPAHPRAPAARASPLPGYATHRQPQNGHSSYQASQRKRDSQPSSCALPLVKASRPSSRLCRRRASNSGCPGVTHSRLFCSAASRSVDRRG